MTPTDTKRGPLRAIILAKTGEDIRDCTHCWQCDIDGSGAMEVSFAEILHAAANDDPGVLSDGSIWECDAVLRDHPVCPSGFDRRRVIEALRDEAILRGYARPVD